jgi:hypothetical protein
MQREREGEREGGRERGREGERDVNRDIHVEWAHTQHEGYSHRYTCNDRDTVEWAHTQHEVEETHTHTYT